MPMGHFLDKQAALLRPIMGQSPKLHPVQIGLDSKLPEDIGHFCKCLMRFVILLHATLVNYIRPKGRSFARPA